MAPMFHGTTAPVTGILVCWLLTGLVPGDRGSRKVNASRETKGTRKSSNWDKLGVQVGSASLVKVKSVNNASVDAKEAEGHTLVLTEDHKRQAPRVSGNVLSHLSGAQSVHIYASPPPQTNVMMLPQELHQKAASKVAQMKGVQPEGDCKEDGDSAHVGCSIGCKCGWGRSCYPKFMYVEESVINDSLEQAHGNTANASAQNSQSLARVNLGMCQLATSVMVVLSLFVFSGTLACVIGLRMYLQATHAFFSEMNYGSDMGGIKVTWPVTSPVITTPQRKPTEYPDMDDEDLNMALEPPTDRRGTVISRPD